MSMPSSNTAPLIKSQIIDTDIHRVWLALTEKEQLKKWCFDIPSFRPEAGHYFSFWGEKDSIRFLHLCRVLEIEYERKMKWLWTYEGIKGESFVTFELFAEGNKTKLVLTHEGLHHLPQDENFARHHFEAGWAALIGDLLPKYLASKD